MQKTKPWAILAAGAAIQVLTGLPAAWGVFQQPVMEEYGLSEQGAGRAFGLLIAAFGVNAFSEPVFGFVRVDYHFCGNGGGVIMTDLVDISSVAGVSAVRDYDTIEG